MFTYCEDCKWMHEDSRKSDPRFRLCTKHPNLAEGFGFVSYTKWDKAEPFLRCRDVNGGACPLFERIEK